MIRADRDHQPAADLQLRLKGLRNLRPAGRHDDGIIRGVLQPGAVAMQDLKPQRAEKSDNSAFRGSPV
jgi:hypothetical protein